MRHAQSIRAVLVALTLAAAPALAEPLDNEQLLALRTAEHVAETASPGPQANFRNPLNDVFGLIAPVLDRPLPATRPVWHALGKWAAASRNQAAGAVTLAGLRREIPDFMADEALADIAARLNANRRMRDLAPIAAERLEVGDTPLAAIRHLEAHLAWRQIESDATTIKAPGPAYATWATLEAAFNLAGLAELRDVAKDRAEQRFTEIPDDGDRTRALIAAAEGRARFGDREGAVRLLDETVATAGSLSVGEGRVRLIADAGCAFARIGEFDRAAEIMNSLPQPIASEVALEIARTHAKAGNVPATETASGAIASPELHGLSRVALAEALALAGRLDEAQSVAHQIQDVPVRAEAYAVLGFLALDPGFDSGASHRLLEAAPETAVAAARLRIAAHAARLVSDPADRARVVIDAQSAVHMVREDPNLQRQLRDTARAYAFAGLQEELHRFIGPSTQRGDSFHYFIIARTVDILKSLLK